MPAEKRLKRTGPVVTPGIVHLGPGAFFRAFNAVYTDEAMAAAGGSWGITAISLKSPVIRDRLAPQDCAYSSVTLGSDKRDARIINSISRILLAPEDPRAVIEAMADPAVKIISLTITEKGYCHKPASGHIDPGHPDIRHDIATPEMPRSAPGFIVRALAVRRDRNAGPLTVLSCDNLPGNGTVARNVVLGLAREVDEDLAGWISENVTFPATMVDRITPATTEGDIERLAESEGYYDPACVVHEAFRQWVIEDDFVSGRPSWDAAGAQFVKTVEAHETMKLRCLNGTHSTLAYLGSLAGYETIADAVADPNFAALCEWLWIREILPTLQQPEGEDLPAYCNALMARYRETSIRHRTDQIAMDGSQKLPQRILGTIAENLDAGRSSGGLCLAVAGWMRYVGGTDENGKPVDVSDPLAGRLKDASESAADAAGKVANILAIKEIFEPGLAGREDFAKTVTEALQTLMDIGAVETVRQFMESR